MGDDTLIDAHPGSTAHQVDRLREENLRLLDLVRYQRSELHEAGLITDEEYASLASEKGSVSRLESYDTLRDRLRKQTQRADTAVESRNSALTALKLAYRKHEMDDESVGWVEVGDRLCDAICEIIGDDGFALWLDEVSSE